MPEKQPFREPAGGWYIPAHEMHLPDGSTLVKPGKAIRRGTTAQVAKWTGLDRRTLHRLADCGIITRARVAFTYYFYPAEIEDLIRQSENDPGLWSDQWIDAYLRRRKIDGR